MKLKFDSTKILPVVIFGLGAVTTLLTNKNETIARNTMKNELKDEILKEVLDSKKN